MSHVSIKAAARPGPSGGLCCEGSSDPNDAPAPNRYRNFDSPCNKHMVIRNEATAANCSGEALDCVRSDHCDLKLTMLSLQQLAFFRGDQAHTPQNERASGE